MNICIQCGAKTKQYAKKYCSNMCQSDHRYSAHILEWKQGILNGDRGQVAKNLSGHIIRYITHKYGSQCARCGWKERNAITGKTPLEIDHIDGNADNNIEDNLILLCPNCHSLTPSYRNLNKGNGRLWRRDKYVKIV